MKLKENPNTFYFFTLKKDQKALFTKYRLSVSNFIQVN